jgi:GMP synthase (glutamine-hydrolysing)
MKPILIIKAGTTTGVLKKELGDFDDWVITGTQLPRSAFIVTPVYKTIPLPQPQYISGIIITGSHANVTEPLPWIEETAQFLKAAAQQDIPILGICFGHQLLAHAFGGRVDFHPNGWELGKIRVHKTEAAETDLLMRVLPSEFTAFASHSQSVIELPPDAERLAYNTFEAHHAFRLNETVWGVQFHPELTCEIMNAYLSHFQEHLKDQAKNEQQERISCKDSEFGATLLKRFVTIVEKR